MASNQLIRGRGSLAVLSPRHYHARPQRACRSLLNQLRIRLVCYQPPRQNRVRVRFLRAQSAIGLAQSAIVLAQSAIGLAQSAIGLARSAIVRLLSAATPARSASLGNSRWRLVLENCARGASAGEAPPTQVGDRRDLPTLALAMSPHHW